MNGGAEIASTPPFIITDYLCLLLHKHLLHRAMPHTGGCPRPFGRLCNWICWGRDVGGVAMDGFLGTKIGILC